jgi:hypothetical protein
MSDDILHQLQQASDSAKKFFEDLLNGGVATEEVIVGTIRDGFEKVNHALGLNLEVPGLSKPPQSPARGLPIGTSQKLYSWMARNRGKTAVIIAVLVTGIVGAGVVVLRARAKRRPRKARRSKHGARKEVVGEFDMKKLCRVMCMLMTASNDWEPWIYSNDEICGIRSRGQRFHCVRGGVYARRHAVSAKRDSLRYKTTLSGHSRCKD